MGSFARFLRSAALAAAVLCSVAPAGADEPNLSPDALLKAGISEMAARRWDRACPLLAKAYRDAQRPEALYHLAVCEEGRDNIATAAAHYDDYLVVFERLSASEQRAEIDRASDAAKRRRKIDGDIPTVKLIIPASAPEGTRVTRQPRDGGPPVEMAVGVPLPIDPGKHVISTEAPGGARWDGTFIVKRGERNRSLELTVLPASANNRAARFGAPVSPVTSGLPPLDPGPSAWRISAYTLGGVGIAGLLLGAITGAITWGQKSVVSANCTEPPSDAMPMPRLCNDKGAQAADLAHTLGLVSTVSFIAGGLLTATGITLFFTEPAPPKLRGSVPSIRVGAIGAGAPAVELKWTW